jgi:hypothetical protein
MIPITDIGAGGMLCHGKKLNRSKSIQISTFLKIWLLEEGHDLLYNFDPDPVEAFIIMSIIIIDTQI